MTSNWGVKSPLSDISQPVEDRRKYQNIKSWLSSDVMIKINRTAFLIAPNKWTQIGHNMCDRRATWSSIIIIVMTLSFYSVQNHESHAEKNCWLRRNVGALQADKSSVGCRHCFGSSRYPSAVFQYGAFGECGATVRQRSLLRPIWQGLRNVQRRLWWSVLPSSHWILQAKLQRFAEPKTCFYFLIRTSMLLDDAIASNTIANCHITVGWMSGLAETLMEPAK